MAPESLLTTPFRIHLEHCQHLDLASQVVECADYVQHLEILVSEFLESYYMVERLWDPDAYAAPEADELVLEPFYASLGFALIDPEQQTVVDSVVCASGAMSPLPSEQHPALTRHGLDFVGLRGGDPRQIALGVTQSSKSESAFVLLLRALNGLAELSPPLRMAQLGRDVLERGIPEDADFSLYLGLAEGPGGEGPEAADARTLVELARDLAEGFVASANGIAQLSGTLAGVTCFDVGGEALASRRLPAIWRI